MIETSSTRVELESRPETLDWSSEGFHKCGGQVREETMPSHLVRGGELGEGLDALRDGILGQLSWKHKVDRGMEFLKSRVAFLG